MLNNNFSKLVKLYGKYKARERNKRILKIFLPIFLILGILFLFLQNSNNSSLENNQTTTKENETKTVKKEEPKKQTLSHVEKEKPQKQIEKTTVKTPEVQDMPKHIIKKTKSSEPEESFKLKITQRESLYNLLLNHKNQKSYSTAIKIAQFYLNEKDYEKAVKWAVEASKKDPSQAQSWIIYAQAKKALGKPEVAKKALSIFLKHNYSQQAQNLLDSL